MVWLYLLSPNDWKFVASAIRKMEEISFYREMGKVRVDVCTLPAPACWGNADMIIGIKLTSPHMFERQYFESVAAARNSLESWSFTP